MFFRFYFLNRSSHHRGVENDVAHLHSYFAEFETLEKKTLKWELIKIFESFSNGSGNRNSSSSCMPVNQILYATFKTRNFTNILFLQKIHNFTYFLCEIFVKLHDRIRVSPDPSLIWQWPYEQWYHIWSLSSGRSNYFSTYYKYLPSSFE